MTWVWRDKAKALQRLLVSVADMPTITVDPPNRTIALPYPYRVTLVSARSTERVRQGLKSVQSQPPFAFVVSTFGAESSRTFTVSMTSETFAMLLKEHYKNVVRPREMEGEHAP